jgi:four helix bundle protein
MDMVTYAYQVTKQLPKEELYGLTAQLRRCAVSIPSNIAEGYARQSTQDYLRFLRVANGSLFEFQAQIEIALNLGYINRDSFEKIYNASREIERMLSSLIKKISESSK